MLFVTRINPWIKVGWTFLLYLLQSRSMKSVSSELKQRLLSIGFKKPVTISNLLEAIIKLDQDALLKMRYVPLIKRTEENELLGMSWMVSPDEGTVYIKGKTLEDALANVLFLAKLHKELPAEESPMPPPPISSPKSPLNGFILPT